MTWRRYLQSRTRNPTFLWRMVVGILLAGVLAGVVVDAAVPAWIGVDAETPEGEPEPEPDQLFPEWKRLEQLAEGGRWLDVWRGIPAAIVHSWRHAGATSLAVLTGACWLAFAVQAVQPRSLRDARLWMAAGAIALGVISVWFTLFLIFWQKQRWGLVESDNLAPGLRFFILGVGLREELSKFVCFLPLLPWCVRRRDELAALMLAGCVGIGFAMEENVNYIWSSVGSATMARLLTPAPFHMATTGLLGLAAYRACVWPKEWGPQLLAMFGVIVLAHGLFDSLLSLPALAGYAIGAMIIFVLLVYQFFRELRPKQALRVEPISLTANFLFCVSTVAAATFAYLSAAAGVQMAGDALIASIVSESVMVYLFLREMPETMVSV